MKHWQCAACGCDLVPRERVGRRDVCPECGAELHCCRQCAFYDPAAYNACREPQAERVLDKGRANFCDYYEVGFRVQIRAESGVDTEATGGTASRDARAHLDALFRKK